MVVDQRMTIERVVRGGQGEEALAPALKEWMVDVPPPQMLRSILLRQ
jgi:hypothetical protein